VTGIGQGLATNPDEALDDMFAFFAACYHLRHWVTGSSHKTKGQVGRLFSRHYELRLCGDLCNGDKHFTIDPARAQYDSTLTTTAAPILFVPGSPVARQPWPRERWLITTARGDEDMFDVADRCVAAWRNFL